MLHTALVHASRQVLTGLLNLPLGSWAAVELTLARQHLGLTSAELAAEVGCEQAELSRIERGETPVTRSLELAARYLIKAYKGPNLKRFVPRNPIAPSQAWIPAQTPISNRADLPAPGLEIGSRDESVMWLRLMPEFLTRPPLPISQFRTLLDCAEPPLELLFDIYPRRENFVTADGCGCFARLDGSCIVRSVTTVFGAGEIWSFDVWYLTAMRTSPYRQPEPVFWMPASQFVSSIDSFRRCLKSLGFDGPYQWIAGVKGLRGMVIPLYQETIFPSHESRQPLAVRYSNPAAIDLLVETGSLGCHEDPKKSLQPFLQRLLAAFGVDR